MNRDSSSPNDLTGPEVREAIAPALGESPANIVHYIVIGILPDLAVKVARDGGLTDDLANLALAALLAD